MVQRILPVFALVSLVLVPTQTLTAQRVLTDDKWCNDDPGDPGSARYCEVREFDLDARALIRVDGRPNGGILIEGWDRSEIRLRTKVNAWSRRGDPQALAKEIKVRTERTVSSDGPTWRERQGWSVSYHLMVPRGSDLELTSQNGGIRIAHVQGDMDLSVDNGGINLEDVAGNVKGRAKNGGVSVYLTGSRWEGEGLDVHANNGGITLSLPGDYQADLSLDARNGSFHTDFPITVHGRLRPTRISTELNGGGPPLRISANNGGVRISRRPGEGRHPAPEPAGR